MWSEAWRPWGIDQRSLPELAKVESGKLRHRLWQFSTVLKECRTSVRPTEHSGMTDAQSCVLHHVQVEWESNLQAPGVVGELHCSTFMHCILGAKL